MELGWQVPFPTWVCISRRKDAPPKPLKVLWVNLQQLTDLCLFLKHPVPLTPLSHPSDSAHDKRKGLMSKDPKITPKYPLILGDF